MKKNRIIIFDTTLRDGEQCPGASMNLREKLEIARQLARLKVDVIEAGFPVISDGDFASVQTIAREVKGPVICGLARCTAQDIDAAGAAVKPAGRQGRIHVFLATSKIHREFKLGKAQDEILRLAVEGVKRARTLVEDVEFAGGRLAHGAGIFGPGGQGGGGGGRHDGEFSRHGGLGDSRAVRGDDPAALRGSAGIPVGQGHCQRALPQ